MVKILDLQQVRKAKKWERWNFYEKELFLAGYNQYGRQWTKVAGIVGTRDRVQVRSYYIKWIRREKILNLDIEQDDKFQNEKALPALPKTFNSIEV